MPDTKVLRSPDKRGDYIGNEIKERWYFPEFYFYKAIENAGGVPFYLVFGNDLEERRYLTIVKGICYTGIGMNKNLKVNKFESRKIMNLA